MMNATENSFLDLSRLISGECSEVAFDYSPSPDLGEENGITVSSLSFSGRAYDLSGFVKLGGKVTAVLDAPCARCLEPVREAFSVDVEYSVIRDGEESEEDALIAEGEKIDLGSLAEEILFTNLPLRLLCREDCKGLCPICGKNLNEEPCRCEPKEIDPRLAVLAELLK